MSRQPSPGPALQNQQPSYYRDQHGNPIEKPGPQIKIVYRGAEQQNAQNQNQGAATPIPIATSSSTGRSKSRAYQSGIAAGAEDVKYAAKYRDLKQKVKEIEADNDRLVFKVLQAKRGIQRAKLERAILYERLGALPASPPQGAAPLPPQHVAQPPVPSGGQVPQHPEAHAYGQASRHHRASGGGAPAPHHHHRQHHQQPIQPAPPAHVSPPQHHATAHHPHHPPHDTAHPGQLPITHAQQVMTVETREGPLLVVAGPDGHPVMTADGHFIPAQEMHPPPASSGVRKRGGRVNKEQRELREREAREVREREEMERKQALLAGGAANSSGSVVQVGGAPQGMPMSHEREHDWDVERELRERDRIQRREGHEHDRDRERERHGHHAHHHHRTHEHHHHHQRSAERRGSPLPPLDVPPPPDRGSSPPPPAHAHRSHSHNSHASYRSHGGHHHVHTHSHHSHSHSASPLLSPGGSSYLSTRIHNHQRVGPGSYVLRDRTAASDVPPPPPETNMPTPAPASGTPSQNDREASTNAPTPTPGPGAATSSRVPTPPYMPRSGRTDAFNNHSEADPDAEGPRGDAPNVSEEGSGAQSVATTP